MSAAAPSSPASCAASAALERLSRAMIDAADAGEWERVGTLDRERQVILSRLAIPAGEALRQTLRSALQYAQTATMHCERSLIAFRKAQQVAAASARNVASTYAAHAG